MPTFLPEWMYEEIERLDAIDSAKRNLLKPIEPKEDVNGVIWDDDGYGSVPVQECEEPMVELGDYSKKKGHPVKCRPVYEGFDPYTGARDIEQSRAGSLGLGGTYMRQSNAEGVIAADRVLNNLGMNLVITDAWRSPNCQVAEFVKYFTKEYERPGLDIAEFIRKGIECTKIASALKVDTSSPQFQEFSRDTMVTYGIELQALSLQLGLQIDELVVKYATFAANVERSREIYRRAPKTVENTRILAALEKIDTGLNISLPLDYNNSTHPSGGSQNMLIESEGVIATPSGFDFVGREGGIMPLEEMSFAELRQRYIEDPNLRTHCMAQFNIEPEKLEDRHFELMKRAMRALHHSTDRSGATHYGSEFQHKQWGNIIKNPLTGEIVYRGRMADQLPNAGNSCHSIQTMVRGQAVAIYGGIFAERDILDRLAGKPKEV